MVTQEGRASVGEGMKVRRGGVPCDDEREREGEDAEIKRSELLTNRLAWNNRSELLTNRLA